MVKKDSGNGEDSGARDYPTWTDPRTYRMHPTKVRHGRGKSSTVSFPDGVGTVDDPRPGAYYLFRPGEFLIPKEDTDRSSRLRSTLADLGAKPVPAPKRKEYDKGPSGDRQYDRDNLAAKALGLSNIVRYRLAPFEDADRQSSVPQVVAEIRRQSTEAEPWRCWPNHVLTGADYPDFGPGKPVQPIPVFATPVEGTAGKDITVAIVDTGVRREHAWLAGHCKVRNDILDGEALDVDGNGFHDYEAGHGTFVAGVVRQFAPGATIVVRGTLHSDGTVSDAEVAGALDSLHALPGLHVVNLSLGGYVYEDEGDGLPLTTDAVRRLQKKFEKVVVVAAAGNDHRSDPFYPAALPDVIGVGALDSCGCRADFSNDGPWVDVWSLGVDVESSYVGPQVSAPGGGGTKLEGAIWSGTSFAAPRVAGLIAAAMSPR